MIINKFEYKPIERITINGKRHYSVNGNHVPSVTTILSATKDMTVINAWRDKVGHDKAKEILDLSVNLGTEIHKNIENYILGEKDLTGCQMSRMLSKILINNIFPNVSEIYGTEVPLHCHNVYAGTSDIVFVHKNQIAIGDFKNSRSEKKEEWMDDYFQQLVAYAMAHNEMFGTNISKGTVMMAVHNGKYLEFEISNEKFQKYTDMWLSTLDKYYEMQLQKA
jgi:CRISPR/Cas system-associated exonuclease Cas4 (RecB family)